MKSVYEVHGALQNQNFDLLKRISKWKGLEKVKGFLWKLGHECLLTNSKRMQFGMIHLNLYPTCKVLEEHLFHLFRDCPNQN